MNYWMNCLAYFPPPHLSFRLTSSGLHHPEVSTARIHQTAFSLRYGSVYKAADSQYAGEYVMYVAGRKLLDGLSTICYLQHVFITSLCVLLIPKNLFFSKILGLMNRQNVKLETYTLREVG